MEISIHALLSFCAAQEVGRVDAARDVEMTEC